MDAVLPADPRLNLLPPVRFVLWDMCGVQLNAALVNVDGLSALTSVGGYLYFRVGNSR